MNYRENKNVFENLRRETVTEKETKTESVTDGKRTEREIV